MICFSSFVNIDLFYLFLRLHTRVFSDLISEAASSSLRKNHSLAEKFQRGCRMLCDQRSIYVSPLDLSLCSHRRAAALMLSLRRSSASSRYFRWAISRASQPQL